MRWQFGVSMSSSSVSSSNPRRHCTSTGSSNQSSWRGENVNTTDCLKRELTFKESSWLDVFERFHQTSCQIIGCGRSNSAAANRGSCLSNTWVEAKEFMTEAEMVSILAKNHQAVTIPQYNVSALIEREKVLTRLSFLLQSEGYRD